MESSTQVSTRRAMRMRSGNSSAARARAGSFLVLVVGTLALLAVITIVYVSLGNQDARTRAAVEKREQLDDVPVKMAEYVAGVVTRDTWALTDTGEQLPGTPQPELFRRETTDVPGVQWNAFSPLTAAQVPGVGEFSFNPVGGLEVNNAGVVVIPGVDIVGLDPWLAPHRPVDLNRANSSNPNEPDYRKNLDWMSITNIAPDGAFVNLFNLRTFGLEATPSQMRGSGVGAAGLSLMEFNGTNDVVTTDLDFGVAADPNLTAHWTLRQWRAYRPAQPSASPLAQRGEDPDNADYKLYQWVDADGDGMLDSRIFELADLSGTGLSQLPTFGGKYRYFFGARIVDLSGLVNVNFAGDQTSPPTASVAGSTPTTQVPLGLTPADIDLRRLLTLEDVYANNDILPAGGQSGAGVGYDQIHQPAGVATLPSNYSGYTEQQAYFTGTAAYLSLRLALASGSVPPVSDYIRSDGYVNLAANTGYAFTTQFGPGAFSDQIQLFAERAGVEVDTTGGAGDPVWPESPSRWKFAEWPLDVAPPSTNAQEVFSLPAARANYFNTQAQRLFQSSTQLATTGDVATNFNGRFGVGDLAELLTRRATNDAALTSALERALAGRDDTTVPPPPPGGRLRYDPLRSNRGEDVERLRYDTVTPGANRNPTLLQLDSDVRSLLTTMSWSRQLRSVPQVPSAAGVGRVSPFALSDGERKIDAMALLDAERTTTLAGGEIVKTGQPDPVAMAAGFYAGYAAALAPYSYIDESWSDQGVQDASIHPYRTLFYGYAGPDVALMTAGHMALNMVDMADARARITGTLDASPIVRTGAYTEDGVPTARTLLLSGDGTYLGDLNNAANANLIAGVFPSWVANQPAQNLQLDPTQLAPNPPGGANDAIVPAVELFGIEPQAFLTQVATLTVYTDLDTTNNVGTSPSRQINIDTSVPTVSATGSDEVLYTMAAFKLVNPFDRPVVLSKDPYTEYTLAPDNDQSESPYAGGRFIEIRQLADRMDRQQDFHYIRFGDRTYMLMELRQEVKVSAVGTDPAFAAADPQEVGDFVDAGDVAGPIDYSEVAPTTLRGITLEPNSTAIVFAISEPPSKILAKLRGISGSGVAQGDFGPDTTVPTEDGEKEEVIRRALLNALGSGPDVPTYWIPMLGGNGYDSATASFVPITAALGGTTADPGVAIDATNGLQDVDLFVDVLPTSLTLVPTATTAPAVTLWRAMRAVNGAESVRTNVPAATFSGTNWLGGPLPTPYAGATGPAISVQLLEVNDYSNDMLVDRLRLPWSTSETPQDIVRRPTFTEFQILNSDEDDNRGLTISCWAVASRRGDLGDASTWATTPAYPTGVLPGYCIEPKYFDGSVPFAWNEFKSNFSDWNDATPDVTSTDFENPSYGVPVPFYNGLFAGGSDGVNEGYVRWLAIAGGTNFGSNTPAAAGPMNAPLDQAVLEKDPRTTPWQQVALNDFTQTMEDSTTVYASAVRTHTNVSASVGGLTYDQMYPAPTIASARFRSGDLDAVSADVQSISIVRLADTLLPWGVGPMRAPVNNASFGGSSVRKSARLVSDPDYYEVQTVTHTTLGEAIAIAMGYENPDFMVTPLTIGTPWLLDPGLRMGPYFDDTGSLGYTLPLPTATDDDPVSVLLFDRCQLALDRFVPFLDVNTNLVYNPIGATPDERWGMRIPAAQAVLEQFMVPVMGREQGQESARESLTRPTPGLLNINTAPVEVLRSLPLASPRPFQFFDGAGPVWRPAYPAAGPYAADAGLWLWPSTAGPDYVSLVNEAWDIPAGIAAYRDQRPAYARPTSRDFANFRMTDPGLGLNGAASYPAPDDIVRFNIDAADPANTLTDRAAATGIDALSDDLGFPSVGALLSVRNPEQADPAMVPGSVVDPTNFRLRGRFAPSRGKSLSIDAIGADNRLASGTEFTSINGSNAAIDPFRGADTGVTGGASPTSPANEYREQLQIANASLNLVTTRSDLFAAWFVVMGFSEQDIAAVREGAASIPARPVPLTPSVQRRFLMVIDRSSVVQNGDKPKILLFKEVPI